MSRPSHTTRPDSPKRRWRRASVARTAACFATTDTLLVTAPSFRSVAGPHPSTARRKRRMLFGRPNVASLGLKTLERQRPAVELDVVRPLLPRSGGDQAALAAGHFHGRLRIVMDVSAED